MASKLSSEQIFKQVMDETAIALRTIPAADTAFSIELNHADGDSVLSVPNSLSASAAVLTGSGVVLPVVSAVGIKSINMIVQTNTTITGPQLLTLEYSPSDTTDIWIATTLTLTPSATANVVVAGTALTSLIARRIRVSTASAIAAGSYTLYIVGHSV